LNFFIKKYIRNRYL